MKYYNSDLPIRLRMTAHRYLLLENNSLLFLAESWERRWLIFFTSSLTLHFIFSIGEKRYSWNLRSINTYNVTFLFVGIFFQQTAFIINFRRCLNVTRKADWTFLNNLATFGGFLFSYFHRFTIGIGAGVGGCLAPGAPPPPRHHNGTICQSSSCNIFTGPQQLTYSRLEHRDNSQNSFYGECRFISQPQDTSYFWIE